MRSQCQFTTALCHKRPWISRTGEYNSSRKFEIHRQTFNLLIAEPKGNSIHRVTLRGIRQQCAENLEEISTDLEQICASMSELSGVCPNAN